MGSTVPLSTCKSYSPKDTTLRWHHPTECEAWKKKSSWQKKKPKQTQINSTTVVFVFHWSWLLRMAKRFLDWSLIPVLHHFLQFAKLTKTWRRLHSGKFLVAVSTTPVFCLSSGTPEDVRANSTLKRTYSLWVTCMVCNCQHWHSAGWTKRGVSRQSTRHQPNCEMRCWWFMILGVGQFCLKNYPFPNSNSEESWRIMLLQWDSGLHNIQ